MSPRVLFEQDLETLKNKVSEMGEHAEISYDHMLYGIRENKEDILKTLLDTDHKMVDMQRSIEAMCLSLLTRQQPVARDMRLVSAALKVVTDIERIWKMLFSARSVSERTLWRTRSRSGMWCRSRRHWRFPTGTACAR